MGLNSKTTYPLSDAQKLLLINEKMSIHKKKIKETCLISCYFQVPADCKFFALEQAFNYLLRCNDALRLTIFKHKFKYWQYISEYQYESIDITKVNGEKELLEIVEAGHEHLIGWLDSKLYKVRIVDSGAGCGTLVMQIHHGSVDGYSMGLIFKQLEYAYNCYSNNTEPQDKIHSIVECLNAEKKYKESTDYKNDYAYWKKATHHQPDYTIPAGRPAGNGAMEFREVIIEGDLYNKTAKYITINRYSTPGFIMGVIAVTVGILSGKNNFAVCTMIHGRRSFKSKQTVGSMANSLPVFYQLDREIPVSAVLEQGYRDYLEALSHGRLSMWDISMLLIKETIRCGVNYHHGWYTFSPMDYANLTANSPYNFQVEETRVLTNQIYHALLEIKGEKIIMSFDYQEKRFKQENITYYINVFNSVLELVLQHPDWTISEIALKIQ